LHILETTHFVISEYPCDRDKSWKAKFFVSIFFHTILQIHCWVGTIVCQ